MVKTSKLDTDRLMLRQWGKYDLPHFAMLNADPEVMEYFPSTLTKQESDVLAKKLSNFIAKNGWGFWAVELKRNNSFIGFVGIRNCPNYLPFSPAVEIGWRLSKQYWGFGYATEAAKASLKFGFETLDLKEIVSFTTTNNEKSKTVMRKIGMLDMRENFGYPGMENGPLKEHVLYKITKKNYRSQQN